MLSQALPYVLWGCLSLKQWKNKIWMRLGAGVLIVVLLVLSSRFHALRSMEILSTEPQQRVIVIDPGHGGEDGGANGISGTRESDLNLAVSLRLEALLRLCGVEPVMVRRTDTAVYSDGAKTISEKKVSDIHNRVTLVNNTPGALLVSIHQNFFTESKYDGAQVFYADSVESKTLAELLQSRLREKLAPDNRREAKPAASTIYLMNHIHCPAILVECGFISNAAEEARLKTPTYQVQLATVIASVLLQNLEVTDEV